MPHQLFMSVQEVWMENFGPLCHYLVLLPKTLSSSEGVSSSWSLISVFRQLHRMWLRGQLIPAQSLNHQA